MKALSRLTVTAVFFLLAPSACSNSGAAPETASADVLSIDELLSIGSVVGGEDHQWAPDGSAVLFAGGGKLQTVGPEGGSPVALGVDLGGAGHFLASQQPKYGPDGQWVSFISVKSGSQELWLWAEAEGREVQLTNLGARINSYNWSPDGRWIAFAGDRHGAYDIWKVEVSSGDVFRLTSDSRYEVFPTWTPDSNGILYVRLDEAWVEHDVFEIGFNGGTARHIVSDSDFFDYQSGGKFGYPLVSPDGQFVLFRSHRSGWLNYWVVSREGGEPRQIAPESADQDYAQWSPDGRQIAYTSNTNGTHSLHVVSLEGGLPRVLASPPGMGVVSQPAWSPDGARISYSLATPTRPADLFVMAVSGGDPRQLTFSGPGSDVEARLVAPEKVAYGSSDGLTIPSYLYRPGNLEPGQKLPALLWIHGGPTSQFNDTFQQHVQFFVDRGYVVLLPNIRGSSGYGKEFEAANMRCWGRCDLEDVLAGVDYLQDQPYVDGNNIGITGTSYGGIMSMAAPTFAPNVFQAAAAIAGYADYPHFMEEQELRHIKLLEYELGPLQGNEELYNYLSPINYVENITTPMMVINGKGYFPESVAGENFVKELERHYKPVQHNVYLDENYYVRGRENRRQMLLDMLEFFDRHLSGHRIVPSIPSTY